MARTTRSNVSLMFFSIVLLVACGPAQDTGQPETGARNVILFVGDGFGAAQMSLGIQYASLVENRELNIELLMRDGNTGYAQLLPFGNIVIDSAASATHLATGQPARNDMLGMDAKGYPQETILEWAHKRGLGTGLVTNMRITHATPGAFAIHQSSRYNSAQTLMDDLLDEQDVDVLLGGGARAIVPGGSMVSEALPGIPEALDGESNREDNRNRVEELADQGFAVASDAPSLREAANHATKLLGLFSASSMPYVIDRQNLDVPGVPTLDEMTAAALEVLSRRDEGFFMLVEGGSIDYTGHANDAGALLHEVLEFDKAVGKAVEFQQNHPDTLIIVTADHGTGGFTFTDGYVGPIPDLTLESGVVTNPEWSYPTTEHLEILFRQSASYSHILEQAGLDPERLIELVRTHTGLEMTLDEAHLALARDADGMPGTADFRRYRDGHDDSASALLAHYLSRHSFVVWSTGEHTSGPVLAFGRGPGAEKLRGIYPNTHIYSVMRESLERR